MLYKSFIKNPSRIKIIQDHVPKHYNRYVDLAVNDGSLFINLAPKKYLINDQSGTIYNMWNTIKEAPDELCEYIDKYSSKHVKGHMFEDSSDASHAAMFMYLQDYKYIHDFEHNYSDIYTLNIKNINNYLTNNNGEILNVRADDILNNRVEKEDFVYLDFRHVNNTNVKIQLLEAIHSLDKKHVKWLVLQSNTPHVKQQYSNYNIEPTSFNPDQIFISNY